MTTSRRRIVLVCWLAVAKVGARFGAYQPNHLCTRGVVTRHPDTNWSIDMQLNRLRAVDVARAAAVALAIATDDDDMALLAIDEAADDPAADAMHALVLACSLSVVQTLEALLGGERARELMRATAVEARAAVEAEAE